MRLHQLLFAFVLLHLIATAVPAHADWFAGEAQSAETAKPAPGPAKKGTASPSPTGPAPAALGDADLTTATYGDWQLRCGTAPAKDKSVTRTCEVTQRIVLQGQTSPFAQLSFGKLAPSDPLYFTVLLPPNIALPSKVTVAAEKDAPVDLAWTRCLPRGCFASVALKDDVLKRWRAHNGSGQISFKTGADQNLTFPFSFKGLHRALDALSK